MRLITSLLAAVAVIFGTCAAELPTHLYACGDFNWWTVDQCVEFNRVGDGVFRLDIDFSRGTNFKISICNINEMPQLSAWDAFDQGAYQIVPGTQVEAGKPLPIQLGIANISAPSHNPTTVTVDFNANTILFGENGGGEVTPYSGTLPVLFINTEGHAPITSKETYLTATYYLDPMGVEGVQAFGSEEAPLNLQIKGRGNYTWTGFDKKPYRLKLESKAALLGMKKSKHFALLAHADDNFGFLRNPVGFELSKWIGMAWTPSQQPVEVMLNGDYIGLYFLTETIRVDKDRVDVVEQPDYATDPEQITGAWLVEIDNYDSDPHITIYDNDYPVFITYKTPEALSWQQEQYLTEQMNTINTLVNGDTNNPELWAHVDMDQLARYYIVQEIVDDYESFHGSCYIYKQQGDNTKWTFGPVWDFGNAFTYNKSQYIYEGRQWYQVWIEKFCNRPDFMERVIKIWKEFDANKLGDIFAYVDDFSSRIATACIYDARRWPQYGNANEAAKADLVKNFLSGSRAWLETQWGMTGIEPTSVIPCRNDLKVTPCVGGLTITSPISRTVSIATADGRARLVNISAGSTTIMMPAGFYIVNGQKIVI